VHDRVRTLSPFDGHVVSEGRELFVQVGDVNQRRNQSRNNSIRSGNVNPRLTPHLHIELEEVDREVEPGSGSVSGYSSSWYKNKPVKIYTQ
jgi:hypothetical protein